MTEEYESTYFLPVEGTKLEDHHKCAMCKHPLTKPKQTPCGCRGCTKCFDQYFQGCEEKVCPAGLDDCEVITSTSLFPDVAIEKDIGNIRFYCPNKGCETQAAWRYFEHHMKEMCDFRIVKCEFCSKPIQFHLLQDHNEECDMVIVKCHKGCSTDEIFTRKQLNEAHHNITHPDCCPNLNANCPFCRSDDSFNKITIKTHADECKQWLFSCPLKEFINCLVESHDITKHMEESQVSHIKLSVKEISKLKEEIAIIMSRMADQDKTINHLTLLVENISKQLKCITVASSSITSLNESNLQSSVTSPSISSQSNVTEQPSNINSPAFFNTIVTEQPSNINPPTSSNTSVFIQSNGTYTWPIDDYANKRKRAIAKIEISVSSDHFYIVPNGYKMCLRAFLNGDGAGYNKYISVFMLLVKGDFDKNLEWPFKNTVTLTLVHPTDSELNKSYTYKPNPASQCFQQPKSEMNAISGNARFVLLSEVSADYHTNDKLTIKISIETVV